MAPYAGYQPVHETFPRKIVEVHWGGQPQNFLLVGYRIITPGSSTPVVLGSKDGTEWTPLPAPPGVLGLSGAAYVRDVPRTANQVVNQNGYWFAVTYPEFFGAQSTGGIFRSSDGIDSWDTVYSKFGFNFIGSGGSSVIGAGISRREGIPVVVVGVGGRGAGNLVAGMVISYDLGDSWDVRVIPNSALHERLISFVSFANGLFFAGYVVRDHPAGSPGDVFASFVLMISADGRTWTEVPVFTEFSDLHSTNHYGESRHMFDGDMSGVTWNGNKDSPVYYMCCTGFWTQSTSAVAIATSRDGYSWTQTGGPFGEWYAELAGTGFGPYTGYENDFTIPSAGQVETGVKGQKKTALCIPVIKFSGEAPSSGTHFISSATVGVFTSPSGNLHSVASGTVPGPPQGNAPSSGPLIGVWGGPSAFSNKNGGTFVTTFSKNLTWDISKVEIYISQRSSTDWRSVLHLSTGINLSSVSAISVGYIPQIENP